MKIPAVLSSQIAKGHVQLVALGANEVSITAKVEGQTLVVTPAKPLIADQEYMLLIHANSKSQKGYYQHIKINQ